MSIKPRILLLSLLLVLAAGLTISPHAQESATDPVVIYLFWGDGCPHCAREHAYLSILLAEYPQVILQDFEVWNSVENRELFVRFGDVFGFTPGSVPTTFISNQYWVGFDETTGVQLTAAVQTCLDTRCADIGAGIVSGSRSQVTGTNPASPAVAGSVLIIPLIGAVTVADQPVWLSTLLIALVDGFNPCSLWVLSILLALVIHSGSRKRILQVGLIYLTVTAATYIVFIVGLFGVLSFVGYLWWIQVAVALMALGFAVINIKDYFWYKEGVSLTLDDSHKPWLYQSMCGLLAADKTPLAIMGSTAVMALGVTLLELPCTSGLPVVWTNLIVANEVSAAGFILLLALYMFVFLIDETALFLASVYTLKAVRFEEKHGRILKLVGGMVMLTLAAVMLIDPEIMSDVGMSLIVFSAAIGATLLILVLHRRVLPHYGIFVGSERDTRHYSQTVRRRL